MKIGILSDTHIPERQRRLPREILKVFSDVNLILHAGDITSQVVLDELSGISPVKAVRGNMDQTGQVAGLPMKLHIEFAGKNIALIHGWGSPRGIRKRIQGEVGDMNPDVIVHGHTHQPYIEETSGILWINPGSPTDRIIAPFRSVALLAINEDGDLEPEIVKLELHV